MSALKVIYLGVHVPLASPDTSDVGAACDGPPRATPGNQH